MSDTSRPRKPRAAGGRSAASGQYMLHDAGGWAVRGSAGRETSVHPTQEAAIKAARAQAEAKGGHFVVHRPDGRMREAYSIGRDPFIKISAVEGIAPSGAAQARTREFDSRGLTPAQRREAIIKAHRPTKG